MGIALTIYQKIISRVKYNPLNSEQFSPASHGPQARKNCNGKPCGKVSEIVEMTYIRHSQPETISRAKVRIIFKTLGFRNAFILS
jgi:hypothetical protein